jgi:chromosomal replication initiator protein
MSDLLTGVNRPSQGDFVHHGEGVNRDHLDEALRRAFTAEELDKWQNSLGLTVNNGTVSVRFPHRFFGDWFNANIRSRFEQAVAATGLNVAYLSRDNHPPVAEHLQHSPAPARPFGEVFFFDNFFVNNKNYFPLASAQEVAQSRQALYNPFVLCGESGSGKSFLLRAIANARSEHGRDSIHVSSIEELHSLYSSRPDARTTLMTMDFFGVDDLQQIARYPYLQDEMLTLFDHFHLHHKQMVFACSGKVANHSFLAPKLKSRLEWGLSVTLKAPDLDIRTQYAQARCRERQLDLSKDKILLLAQRFGDLRNLEGCLLKLWAYQELVHDQISDEEFDNILNYIDDRASSALTVEQITDAVCRHFQVTREALLSAGRRHELVFARQVAMYLCRRHLGLSFPELGRAFGGRDHSTALYSFRKIEQLQRDDKSIKSMLHALTEKCLAMNETGVA